MSLPTKDELRPLLKRAFEAGRAFERQHVAVTFAAPGPPPHPGWEWHDETKHWRNPANWDEKEPHPSADDTVGAVASADRATSGPSTASHTFPSGDELARAPSENLKPGGQVKAVEVNGKKYVLKQAHNTGLSGPLEVLSSELAKVAGVTMPVAAMTSVNGQPAVVQSFVHGKTLNDTVHDPGGATAALAKVPREQVDKQALFDYLLGHSDVHSGNYMVAPQPDGSNSLVAIDKEFVLGRGNLTSQRFQIPHFLIDAAPNRDPTAYRFDPKTVGEMGTAGDKMAAELDAKGMKTEARQVRDRAVVLKKLATESNTTAGDLYNLGMAGVTPPHLGFFGRIAWHLTKG